MLARPLDLPTLCILAAALWVAAIAVATSRRRDTWLAVAVGGAAGFDFAQLANVHLFSAAVAVWALFSQRGSALRLPSGAAGLLGGAAVVLACTGLVGDLVVSPTLGLQLVGFAGAAMVLGAKLTKPDLEIMLRALLGTVLIAAAWSVGQKAGLLPVPVLTGEDMVGRVPGIYREPDWLGLFCAVGMLVTLYGTYSRPLKLALLGLLTLGMVYSSARSQLGGLALVGLLTVAGAAWRGRHAHAHRRRNAGTLVLLALLGSAALYLSPATAERLSDRLGRTVTADRDTSAQARFQQLASLQQLSATAPWHGHGLSAAGRVGVSGRIYWTDPTNAVASNWILGWWVDGRWLALPLIGSLLWLSVRSARNIGGWLLILVLATSMFSNATFTPILWFAVGVSLAHLRWARTGKRRGVWDRTDRMVYTRRPASAPRGAESPVLT